MKLKLPTNWDEITAGQYAELRQVDPANFSEHLDYRLERLAILADLSPEEVESTFETYNDVLKLTRQIDWTLKRPKGKFTNQIEDFTLKPFTALTLGEFIDLEYFTSDDYYQNAGKIAAILYRKSKVGEWGEKITEPYKAVDINERSEFFEDQPISVFQGVIEKYLKYRDEFLKKWSALFEDDNEDENEPEETPKTIDEHEAERKEKAVKKWSWEALIYKICQGDLTRFEAVTDLSLIFVFNMEAMKQELGVKE